MNNKQNFGLAPILGIILALIIIAGGVYLYYRNYDNKYSGLTEATDFSQNGYLAKDNPGLKSNVWYLIYEIPGASALNMELIFDQKSVCVSGTSKELCSLFMKSVYIGSRVSVNGQLQENGLLVRKLEVLP